MEEVVGFTQKQREWFLARDGNRCQFHFYNGRKWVRCKNTTRLQVHHILPRGWARVHLPKNFQLNGSMNGITLCEEHHVGVDSIHPDTFKARLNYRAGDKKAFDTMMDNRNKLNLQGIPYWRTNWDWMFYRISRKATLKYIRKNPYPVNNSRGNTGRVQA